MQDTWLEAFDRSSDNAYFAVSRKGWTNEELGMSWLTKIFDPHTKAKAGLARRLLLVDGHSSHVNPRFIEYCDQNNIILAVLPPHSTHRLQPLDVGIFAPLAHAYGKGIDRLIQSSDGFSRMTKRRFWPIFRDAWDEAFTLANVRSAFASPGIFPYNPAKVLGKVQMKTPAPPSSDDEQKCITPGSVRAMRRTIKAIAKEQGVLNQEIQWLIRGAEKLAIRNEILDHENRHLRQALVDEKRAANEVNSWVFSTRIVQERLSSSRQRKWPLYDSARSILRRKRSKNALKQLIGGCRSRLSGGRRLGKFRKGRKHANTIAKRRSGKGSAKWRSVSSGD